MFSTQFVGKNLTDSWWVSGENLSEIPLGQQLAYDNDTFGREIRHQASG